MRFVLSNLDTTLLSDPTRGFLVKLKLAVANRISARRQHRVDVDLRYRDSPILEIALGSAQSSNHFSIAAGDYVCVAGADSSDRLGLFNKLCLEQGLDAGAILSHGRALSSFSKRRRRQWIARKVGFVSAGLPLAPELSVHENVRVRLLLDGVAGPLADDLAFNVLSQLGLRSLAAERPDSLSLNECQLVEVARAVAGDLELLILEDFPRTANTRERIDLVAAVWRLARSRGIAVLHDADCLEAVPYGDVVFDFGQSQSPESAGAFAE